MCTRPETNSLVFKSCRFSFSWVPEALKQNNFTSVSPSSSTLTTQIREKPPWNGVATVNMSRPLDSQGLRESLKRHRPSEQATGSSSSHATDVQVTLETLATCFLQLGCRGCRAEGGVGGWGEGTRAAGASPLRFR
jgi:hypothetical protein